MKSRSMRHKSTIAIVMLVSLFAASIAFAAPVLIDSFDVDQSLDTTAGSVESFVSGGSIMGVERDIQLTWLSGGNVSIASGGGGDILNFSLGPTSTGRAWVSYDGVDGSSTVDTDGLCVNLNCSPASISDLDLTGGGTNDSLHFEIRYNNTPFPVEFRVYSGGIVNVDYISYQVSLPGSISLGSHVDLLIPLTSGWTVHGNGASLTNVGAFQIYLNGTDSPGSKLNLDFFQADSNRDFGDALGYASVSHRPDGLRLGASVDSEDVEHLNLNATGDDSDQIDDEDGVVRTVGVNWTGTSGSVNVTVNGCAGTCYLNGWVDFDGNGTFESDERIFSDTEISSNGTSPRPFVIAASPEPTYDTSYYARFRLCDAASSCSTPSGSTDSGEVEDYRWDFGPTAVFLDALSARSGVSSQTIWLVALAFLLVFSALSLYIWVHRRQAE